MEAWKKQFLDKAANAAYEASQPFDAMAACEAGLECTFGTSKLAIADNNLFGMKQHSHPVYGTHNLPTREFIGIAKEQSLGVPDGVLDGWIVTLAAWVKYPGWRECFEDRLATLKRLAPMAGFEHYRDALNATDCVSYVKCVSAKWSTDPKRADKVIAIYDEYMGG